TEMRGESATDSSSKTRSKIRLDFALISSAIADDREARFPTLVALGTLLHAPRRIAHGTARRDGGRCPRYAGASDWVRAERCRRAVHDPRYEQHSTLDRDRRTGCRRLAPGRRHCV